MCLAVPMKVLEIDGDSATVEMWGVRKTAELSLLEEVQVGDYVLLHAGFAIQVVNQNEARETLKIFQKIMAQEKLELQSEQTD